METSSREGGVSDNRFDKWLISLLNIVITCFPRQPCKNVEIQIIVFQKSE